MSESVDVTNMMWRPALLQLTQIGNPDWDNGTPTVCFIDPSAITKLSRVVASFPTRADPTKKHPDVSCTEVFYCHGALHVIESPEEIAMMRDKIFGHAPQKPKAV